MEGAHIEHAGPDQSGETRLAGPVAPELADDSGRYVESPALVRRELDQPASPPVVALESSERACIEDDSPRTCLANASSSGVAAPFSACISASSTASSSRRGLSSMAWSPQAVTEEARPAATRG